MHVDRKKTESHWIVFMVCIFGWLGLSAWGTRSLCFLLPWLCKARERAFFDDELYCKLIDKDMIITSLDCEV